jgi:hypothetical protein
LEKIRARLSSILETKDSITVRVTEDEDGEFLHGVEFSGLQHLVVEAIRGRAFG